MSNHLISFSGEASVNHYQQALRAVTYQNSAPEPSSASRTIVYQVSDEEFASNNLTGYITIGLIDDNDLILSCGSSPVLYTEGSSTTIISSTLMLSDLDDDHQVTSASIAITNPQNGDGLSVGSVDGLSVANNGVDIQITGESTASAYQVENNQ